VAPRIVSRFGAILVFVIEEPCSFSGSLIGGQVPELHHLLGCPGSGVAYIPLPTLSRRFSPTSWPAPEHWADSVTSPRARGFFFEIAAGTTIRESKLDDANF
jgi:hypothetical protein